MSKIEWTEKTWNPIIGCSIHSPGCIHCYAMPMAARIEAMNAAAKPGHETAPHYAGTTRKVNGQAVWTGKVALAGDDVLLQPLRRRKPTTWFVNSMGDLFHERVPDEWIDRVFAVMALTPQHTYQVLTKRAQRMRDYFCKDSRWRNRQIVVAHNGVAGVTVDFGPMPQLLPLPNVWLGVSAERQQEADERIPLLLRTPAAIRFISAEPLLGPLDLTVPHIDLGIGRFKCHPDLDLVIAGGESGPKARLMHPRWVRSLRDQCAAAGIPFFFKQWGAWVPVCALNDDEIDGLYHPAPQRDPEARRRCKFETRVLHVDGSVHYPLAPQAFRAGSDPMTMFNVGKARAGRLLDCVEHNAMPSHGRIAT